MKKELLNFLKRILNKNDTQAGNNTNLAGKQAVSATACKLFPDYIEGNTRRLRTHRKINIQQNQSFLGNSKIKNF